jgi:hypothetical protein
MAKRYGGMEGGYEGMADRLEQETKDAGMIRENHAAIANLPQEVMIKPWPMGGGYLPEDLDDTISGVNRQMNMDAPVRKRGDNKGGFHPEKLTKG